MWTSSRLARWSKHEMSCSALHRGLRPGNGRSSRERAAADLGSDYLRDIKPLLRSRCVTCHGPITQGKQDCGSSAARLILKGGDEGAGALAGKSRDEQSIARIEFDRSDERMPPEEPRSRQRRSPRWRRGSTAARRLRRRADDTVAAGALVLPAAPSGPDPRTSGTRAGPPQPDPLTGSSSKLEARGLDSAPTPRPPALMRRAVPRPARPAADPRRSRRRSPGRRTRTDTTALVRHCCRCPRSASGTAGTGSTSSATPTPTVTSRTPPAGSLALPRLR